MGCDSVGLDESMEVTMPWTETTRGQYQRDYLRHASDLTDAEWAVIEPHMPELRALGRPRKTDLGEIVNALLYIAATGCQWRMLPKDFPTPLDGAWLFLSLARRRYMANDQSLPCDASPRSGRARSTPLDVI